MNEKEEQDENSENYGSKLAEILKSTGVKAKAEEFDISDKPIKKVSGIQKIDLGEDGYIDANDIDFEDEEEKERMESISRIMEMVDSNEEKKKMAVSSYLEKTSEAEPEEITSLEKIKISPILAPVYVSWNAYRRMVGYAIRYANEEMDSKK